MGCLGACTDPFARLEHAVLQYVVYLRVVPHLARALRLDDGEVETRPGVRVRQAPGRGVRRRGVDAGGTRGQGQTAGKVDVGSV